MSRRLGIALLALSVALAGVAVCSRGVMACSALEAATPDCCGDDAALSQSDCCCPAREAAADANLVGDRTPPAKAMTLLATAPAPLAPAVLAAAPAFSSTSLARAMAPPDTPVSRRVTLLL